VRVQAGGLRRLIEDNRPLALPSEGYEL